MSTKTHQWRRARGEDAPRDHIILSGEAETVCRQATDALASGCGAALLGGRKGNTGAPDRVPWPVGYCPRTVLSV